MSEQDTNLDINAAQEAPITLENIPTSPPRPEEEKIEFPHAQESREKAALQFRKGIAQMLAEAVKGGINKTIVEVSAVSEELVDAVATELREKGYGVYFEHTVKIAKGYTSRQMVVKYE